MIESVKIDLATRGVCFLELQGRMHTRKKKELSYFNIISENNMTAHKENYLTLVKYDEVFYLCKFSVFKYYRDISLIEAIKEAFSASQDERESAGSDFDFEILEKYNTLKEAYFDIEKRTWHILSRMLKDKEYE